MLTELGKQLWGDAVLKHNDGGLESMLEAHQIGTFAWVKSTGKITGSADMERRFGLQPCELSTLAGWVARIDPTDLLSTIASIGDYVRRGAERFRFKCKLMVPIGGVRWLEGSGRLIFDAEGQLSSMVGILIDVTDRQGREQALLAEHEQLRLMLQTVPSALVIFDEMEIIQAFSASAERLFGYSAEEVIGRHMSTLSAGLEPGTGESFIERYLKSGNSYSSNGRRVVYAGCRDGGMVPIELSTGDLRIGQKRLFVGYCKDQSNLLASEERLQEMRGELAHVARSSMRGEVAADLAHQLNQPLAASIYFLGAAELVLNDSANGEQVKALLKLARDQTLRAAKVIRRMRDAAPQEGLDLQFGPVVNIIEDAVALALIGQPRLDIKIIRDMDPDAPIVLCDRVQIGHVVINLVRNAFEALRKSPSAGLCILIGTKQLNNGSVRISVTTGGTATDPEMASQLFLVFDSTRVESAMGIGLSICRRIVEAHGGALEAVNGAAGETGYCFTLSSGADEARGEE